MYDKPTYRIDITCKTCGKTYMHMYQVFFNKPFDGSNESICPFCNRPNDIVHDINKDSRSVRNGKEE